MFSHSAVVPIIHLIHAYIVVMFRYHFSFMILIVELWILADNEYTSALRKYALINFLTVYDYPLVVRWNLSIYIYRFVNMNKSVHIINAVELSFPILRTVSHTWVFAPWQTVPSVQIVPWVAKSHVFGTWQGLIIQNKKIDDFDHFVRLSLWRLSWCLNAIPKLYCRRSFFHFSCWALCIFKSLIRWWCQCCFVAGKKMQKRKHFD